MDDSWCRGQAGQCNIMVPVHDASFRPSPHFGFAVRCIFLWLSALAPLATASEPTVSSFDAQCFGQLSAMQSVTVNLEKHGEVACLVM